MYSFPGGVIVNDHGLVFLVIFSPKEEYRQVGNTNKNEVYKGINSFFVENFS